jgi:hypothetical protein
MSSRYFKYNYLLHNYILSKQNLYEVAKLPKLIKLDITAGHYKLNGLFVEHGLVLLSITGKLPVLRSFLHGKRLKRTLTLQTSFFDGPNSFKFLDKFVNLILPNTEDLVQSTQHRVRTTSYEWRTRYYFEGPELGNFVSDRLARRGVFMPLSILVTFQKDLMAATSELYLRMLRLPLFFTK